MCIYLVNTHASLLQKHQTEIENFNAVISGTMRIEVTLPSITNKFFVDND